ncbi:MAG TPA: hypothetical protein VGQ83_37815 [Polyangia bacterium]
MSWLALGVAISLAGAACSAGKQARRGDGAAAPGVDEPRAPEGGGTITPTAGGITVTAPPAGPVACAGAYGPGFKLAVGTVKRTMPLIPEPAPRTPFLDPVFKTCVVRLTDRKHDGEDDRSIGMKNEYSRVNSFNADGSHVLVRGTEATWYLYDARSFKRVTRLAMNGAVDPRWDARDPNKLYYTPDTRLMELDVKRNSSRVIRDFAKDLPQWHPETVFGRWEGSPSLDGTTFAFMVKDRKRARGLIVYDLRDTPRDTDGKPGEIIGRYDLDAHKPLHGDDPDSVSMSLSGKYVWAQFDYCERDAPTGTYARPCGAMVYDRTLGKGRGVVRAIGHADLALDANGRDVAIFQDNDKDQVSIVDLETGTTTALHAIDFSQGTIGFHFSGRAAARPGWALVSAYDKVAKTKLWLSHLVYAVELKAGGRIVPLAHHHSLRDDDKGEADYFAEPHASTNLDLTRIIFTSNWGRVGTNTVDVYLIMLPPDWTSRLGMDEG